MGQPKITLYEFTQDFLELNQDFVSRYASLRVRGYHAETAFRRVFGIENCDSNMREKIDVLESSDVYERKFHAAAKTIPVSEIINPRLALIELMTVYRNPHFRDSTRLRALNDAMIVAGITTVDENGKTKAGATLDDFYKAEGLRTPPPPPVYGEPMESGPVPPTLQ
ncbi:hypothetical protein FX016_21770 [Cupriavidus gilardii]|nr:hypothetical protein FX016_21770 [Cupriavidus gilardii]